MGVSQDVKTKYVFRLPIPFLKTKRMNMKGNHVDDTDEDSEDGTYTNVPPTVRVRYESEVESEAESDEDVDEDVDPLDISVCAAPRQRKRLVSWDGVKDQARSRWTMEQEKKLLHAQEELARCQKAWSSEQDVWLKCVSDLAPWCPRSLLYQTGQIRSRVHRPLHLLDRDRNQCPHETTW
ncbi:hypothetical protein BDW62DRAFT_99268 [Aspergillus aurantiobrunneus]